MSTVRLEVALSQSANCSLAWRLALQKAADEIGLAMRAGLVENVSEVRPCRRHRDPKPDRRRVHTFASQYFERDRGFRRGQPKILAQPALPHGDSRQRIGDEQNRTWSGYIDPAELDVVRHYEQSQRLVVLSGEPHTVRRTAQLSR